MLVILTAGVTFFFLILGNLVCFFFFNFFKNFILFLNFTILYWFCQISKWTRHRYTCVPHPEPSSLLQQLLFSCVLFCILEGTLCVCCVQLLGRVWLFAALRPAACSQASPSFTSPGVCSDSYPLSWWC